MSNTISFRFRAIVLCIFLILFSVIFAAITYLNEVSQSQSRHYLILSELTQLDETSRSFKQRGEYYVVNAPRDYESYIQDVVVFHTEMQKNIDGFETKLHTVLAQHQSEKGGFQTLQNTLLGKQWR